MRTLNCHFRGQMEDEKVITFSRKHWIALLPDLLPFALFMAIVIVLFFSFSNIEINAVNDEPFQILVIMSVISVGLIIHRFFLHVMKYFMSITIFTNFRIVEIKKTLFLHDIKESLYYNEIQDVEYEQEGLFKNMLKLGSINITLGGGNETKQLNQIPNPDFHFRLISKLKSDYFINQNQNKIQREHQILNPVSPPHIYQAASHSVKDSQSRMVKTTMGDYVL